jgi:hypothetical protein
MPYVCSSGAFPRQRPFPPEHRLLWLNSVLAEIASGRAVVTSRGKRNPRGVKRKMSGYRLRKRGDPLNQSCDPKPQIMFI